MRPLCHRAKTVLKRVQWGPAPAFSQGLGGSLLNYVAGLFGLVPVRNMPPSWAGDWAGAETRLQAGSGHAIPVAD